MPLPVARARHEAGDGPHALVLLVLRAALPGHPHVAQHARICGAAARRRTSRQVRRQGRRRDRSSWMTSGSRTPSVRGSGRPAPRRRPRPTTREGSSCNAGRSISTDRRACRRRSAGPPSSPEALGRVVWQGATGRGNEGLHVRGTMLSAAGDRSIGIQTESVGRRSLNLGGPPGGAAADQRSCVVVPTGFEPVSPP